MAGAALFVERRLAEAQRELEELELAERVADAALAQIEAGAIAWDELDGETQRRLSARKAGRRGEEIEARPLEYTPTHCLSCGRPLPAVGMYWHCGVCLGD